MFKVQIIRIPLFMLGISGLLFRLFAETITNREEVPASLLVHVPNIRFLSRVLRVRFIDEMHDEEPIFKINQVNKYNFTITLSQGQIS